MAYACVETQTPPAVVPLPLRNLANGVEAGFYMSQANLANGKKDKIIHYVDCRIPETATCPQGDRTAVKLVVRPCRCCLLPYLLVDTPHKDPYGTRQCDINDPALWIVPRPWKTGRDKAKTASSRSDPAADTDYGTYERWDGNADGTDQQ